MPPDKPFHDSFDEAMCKARWMVVIALIILATDKCVGDSVRLVANMKKAQVEARKYRALPHDLPNAVRSRYSFALAMDGWAGCRYVSIAWPDARVSGLGWRSQLCCRVCAWGRSAR